MKHPKRLARPEITELSNRYQAAIDQLQQQPLPLIEETLEDLLTGLGSFPAPWSGGR
jgi:hypothetical protein